MKHAHLILTIYSIQLLILMVVILKIKCNVLQKFIDKSLLTLIIIEFPCIEKQTSVN